MNSFGLNGSFLLPHVHSMLLSIPNDQIIYAAVPIMVCLAGIHLIFRFFFAITWFSFKIFLALLVYVQIRDVVSSYIGQNISSFQYITFGVPPGTFELTASIGMQVIKARVISTMLTICPTCFVGLHAQHEPVVPVVPVVPVNPLQEEEDTSMFSWIDWVRDLMTM